MDFLKIRKKAKERAPAGKRADPRPEAPAPSVPPPSREVAPPASKGPAALTDPAAGDLAARLQGLPEPPAAPSQGPDPRFTTWRPGSGERPFVAPPEPPKSPAPVADFTVFKPPPPPEGTTGPAAPPPREAVALQPLPVVFGPPPPAQPPAVAPARPAVPRDPLDEFFYREDEEALGMSALPTDAEPAPSAAAEDAGVEEYLTFSLGAEEYAVPIEGVREVLKTQAVTEVPRAPAGVLGVITVRGEVVAVFDPRRRLGLPGSPPEGSARIVIVDDGEGPCGLLVDGVASVVRLARGSIEPCPQGIGGASADCLAGIGRERSRLFTVLDLGALLRRAPGAARGGRAAHGGA